MAGAGEWVLVTLLALAASLAWRGRTGAVLGRSAEAVSVATAVVVFAALFLGGLLLMTGLRPASMLHLLVAFAALATRPAALVLGVWSERGRGRGAQRYRWLAGGGLVMVAWSLLLTQTG
jgi:hypothetical protein